ncbi:hypothetical protein HK100_003245 [Physocladia obscura]|uniref:Uncharacterized protein n=1 Tax=Physocladia obscura TaxID=109957 RepID=A0AAD5TCD1_9FUNG|nr:hypothetical protein HK100_003245 [Physocladia obscura]
MTQTTRIVFCVFGLLVLATRNSLSVFNRNISHASVRNYPWAALLLVLALPAKYRLLIYAALPLVLALAVKYDASKWRLLSFRGFTLSPSHIRVSPPQSSGGLSIVIPPRSDSDSGADFDSDFGDSELSLLLKDSRETRLLEKTSVLSLLLLFELFLLLFFSLTTMASSTCKYVLLSLLRAFRLIPSISQTIRTQKQNSFAVNHDPERRPLLSPPQISRSTLTLVTTSADLSRTSFTNIRSPSIGESNEDLFYDAQENQPSYAPIANISSPNITLHQQQQQQPNPAVVTTTITTNQTSPTSAFSSPSGQSNQRLINFPDASSVFLLRISILAFAVPCLFTAPIIEKIVELIAGASNNDGQTAENISNFLDSACAVIACGSLWLYIDSGWQFVKKGWVRSQVERVRNTFFTGP